MVDIRVPQKYRWQGKWPKSQQSKPTHNGGDGYLEKNKRKRKLTAAKGEAQRLASAKGMRYLHITASGKRTWRYMHKTLAVF